MINTLWAGNQRSMEGNTHAPEFPKDIQWLNTDQPIALADLQGKFVLLDFWTYCCINCMHILPDLAKLEEEYKDELVVIGVHSAKFENEGDTKNIREAIERYGIRHPVANDRDFLIWRNFGVRAWPTTVLIAPNGNIIVNESGEGVYNRLKPVLDEAIPYWQKKKRLNSEPYQYMTIRQPESLLYFPGKIFYDSESRMLTVSNSNKNQILIIDTETNIIQMTIGSGHSGQNDGDFATASFNKPQGVFRQGDVIYVADTENHLIRKIDLKIQQVSTILGTGEQARVFNQSGYGTQVAINSPWDIYQIKGNLYIAMAGFHQIWRMRLSDGYAEPFAGSGYENIVDGRLHQSQMAQPSGITFDGEYLYVADSETSSLRRISLTDESRAVKTLIGTGLFDFGDVDGKYPTARLQHPLGVCSADGKIYVADTYNDKIKVFDLKTGNLKSWGNILLNEPSGITTDGTFLYITDTNHHRLIKANIQNQSWQEMNLVNDKVVILHKNQSGDMRLELELPTGTKINPETDSFLQFGDVTVKIEANKIIIPSGKLKVSQGSLTLYYCDDAGLGLCYFQELNVIISHEIASDQNTITIHKP